MNRLVADARWLDALSGEFKPLTDKQGGLHRLSRLAIGVCERGRGDGSCLDYIPSWGGRSYAMLEHSSSEHSDAVTRLTIAETRGRWPRVVEFSHETLEDRDYLVLAIRHGEKSTYPLDGSVPFDSVQAKAAQAAQEFYARVAMRDS